MQVQQADGSFLPCPEGDTIQPNPATLERRSADIAFAGPSQQRAEAQAYGGCLRRSHCLSWTHAASVAVGAAMTLIDSRNFSSLVALRAKQGEFTALNTLDQMEHLRHVQPLLELDEASSMSPANQLEEVEAVARKLHQLDRSIMIDGFNIAGVHGLRSGAVDTLSELADRLVNPADLLDDRYPVPFIPVVRCDATDAEVAACGRLCHELGRGGALRARLTTADHATIERLVHLLRVETTEIDLIIDLEYVPTVTPRLVEHVATTANAISRLGPFRTMSLLSGSIPPQLERISTWEQPRVEEHLWRSLVDGDFPGLRLGDYGVVHPLTRAGYRSKHVSVKYTCLDHWLYSRERVQEADGEVHQRSTESPRARTFRAVCRNLVDSDSFAGFDFSWGDREILSAAEGRGEGLGGTSKPVAVATSHHLAYLASRTAA